MERQMDPLHDIRCNRRSAEAAPERSPSYMALQLVRRDVSGIGDLVLPREMRGVRLLDVRHVFAGADAAFPKLQRGVGCFLVFLPRVPRESETAVFEGTWVCRLLAVSGWHKGACAERRGLTGTKLVLDIRVSIVIVGCWGIMGCSGAGSAYTYSYCGRSN